MCLILYRAVSLRRVRRNNPYQITFRGEMMFQNSKRFVKLLSVSVPDTRGLCSVHVIPFFELEFFLIVESMSGYFAGEFADGTPHLRAMLVHTFSSETEID